MDSKFIKTLGELKMYDSFKFIFNGEVDSIIYTVFQIGHGESAASAINRPADVYHHSAKVFQINKTVTP